MTTFVFNNQADLTPAVATNIYLYGTKTAPADYMRQTSEEVKIQVDMGSYMKDGPGRFANPSQAKFVQDFYMGKISLPDGTYTKEELVTPYGIPNKDFNFDLYQENLDPKSVDYTNRVYIFGKGSFTIASTTKFVINGNDLYSIDMAVRGYDENFDFESDAPAHQLGDIFLKNKIDPGNMGRRVEIEMRGTENVPTTPVYTHEDFLKDKQKFESIPKGNLWDAKKVMDKLVENLQYEQILNKPTEDVNDKDITVLMQSEAYRNTQHPDHKKIYNKVTQWFERKYGTGPQKFDATGKPVRPSPLPPRKPSSTKTAHPKQTSPGKSGPVHVREHTREKGREHVRAHDRARPQSHGGDHKETR